MREDLSEYYVGANGLLCKHIAGTLELIVDGIWIVLHFMDGLEHPEFNGKLNANS